MPVPILTDGLIERTLAAERYRMSPNGWGYSGWSLGATTALATLTPDGWCQVVWIEREARTSPGTRRYRVWWHVDTGEVRAEAELSQ